MLPNQVPHFSFPNNYPKKVLSFINNWAFTKRVCFKLIQLNYEQDQVLLKCRLSKWNSWNFWFRFGRAGLAQGEAPGSNAYFLLHFINASKDHCDWTSNYGKLSIPIITTHNANTRNMHINHTYGSYDTGPSKGGSLFTRSTTPIHQSSLWAQQAFKAENVLTLKKYPCIKQGSR